MRLTRRWLARQLQIVAPHTIWDITIDIQSNYAETTSLLPQKLIDENIVIQFRIDLLLSVKREGLTWIGSSKDSYEYRYTLPIDREAALLMSKVYLDIKEIAEHAPDIDIEKL